MIALTGTTLIDVRTGAQYPNTTVVVDGERIASVGEANVPGDAQVIDASGTWALPGLIDMHAHTTGEHAREKEQILHLYLAYGVTTVRDTGGNLAQLRLLRDALKSGNTLGPRLFFAGPLLDGIPPVWPAMSILVDTPPRARSAVQFLADQGVDWIKVYNWVPAECLSAIIETAHSLGLPVTGHVPRAMTMTRVVEMGIDCLEHIRITGRDLLPLEEANQIDPLPVARRETRLWQRFDLDSDQMSRVVQQLAESRVFLDPTLLVDASLSLDGHRTDMDNPANADVPTKVRDTLSGDEQPAIFELSAGEEEAARHGFFKRQQFISVLSRAGVRLLAGTDCFGLGKQLPGLGLQNELALLVESGLSPLAAIQAATLTAAEALGQLSEMGSIEVGKLADLVLLDADPLRDIQRARAVRLVLKGGQVFEVAALKERGRYHDAA